MIKPWIATVAIAIAATSVRAAEPAPPTDKSNVIAFGAGNGVGTLEYRRTFLQSRLALIAIAGYQEVSAHSNDSTGDYHTSQHSTQLGLGVRHNFATIEQVRPFVQLSVSRNHSNGYGCMDSSFWGYAASGGGEYFVSRRVSFEGSAGVEVGRASNDCGGGTISAHVHATTLNTFRTALGINFYF